MKYTILLAALLPLAAYAQRITGDSACVNSCYQISVAVTQCPDLTDSGVISCICPNATQVAQLDQCHGCISSLQGVTDLESNSINTLYGACANGTTSASSSGARSSSTAGSSSGTLGSNNAAQTSSPAGNGNTGAAFKNSQAVGGVAATIVVAALATLVAF
ncbi:hypothetical protein P389DRAFT_171195 [Cystobasidium minutum MCA 4210]|uniref:uncharacterized protein n=1 Tax=Cystobasidium minutum MCA 4210 TaxID=1397322 RepID=UPI0034CE2BDF|eukprot:jgi/Rhomi1/171195/fgenesh1_kg.4_\